MYFASIQNEIQSFLSLLDFVLVGNVTYNICAYKMAQNATNKIDFFLVINYQCILRLDRFRLISGLSRC